MSRCPHLLPFVTLLLGGVLVMGGCDDEDASERFAPADCLTTAPETGRLQIRITINGENKAVPLTVYRGNWEDNNVEFVDTLRAMDWSGELPVDRVYSATATYQVGETTVIALDDGSIDLTYTDYEDARCWKVEHASLNLELDADK